ncbi:hypothetical protein QBC35DRAFT_436582 [Podospora australis]|uniref:Uncharacterized protein n=1 Tax=Podospora australis TaxID=1536484 RepID=A0AAN7AIC6_9PEZI|nr:hypothetical protein QBC35DRAFT_436582 [Podospora australis]
MPVARIKNVRAVITPAYRNSSARYVSSTLPRQAMPTSSSSNDPRGGEPVDDIDVVFDYPSSAQGKLSRDSPSLESAGLGSAMYGGQYTGRGIDEAMDSARSAMDSMGSKMGSSAGSMGSKMDSMGNTIKGEIRNNIKEPMKRLDKEMGFPDNNMIYMGLGALGLGALYLGLREPPPSEEIRRRDPTLDARRGMQNVKHNYPAHAPLENKVEKMIGRTG